MGMKIYCHKDLTCPAVVLNKFCTALQEGRRLGLKKLRGRSFWRAKLDQKDRLLFNFLRFGGETGLYIFEYLPQHAYQQSSFLRGRPWGFEDFRPWTADWSGLALGSEALVWSGGRVVVYEQSLYGLGRQLLPLLHGLEGSSLVLVARSEQREAIEAAWSSQMLFAEQGPRIECFADKLILWKSPARLDWDFPRLDYALEERVQHLVLWGIEALSPQVLDYLVQRFRPSKRLILGLDPAACLHQAVWRGEGFKTWLRGMDGDYQLIRTEVDDPRPQGIRALASLMASMPPRLEPLVEQAGLICEKPKAKIPPHTALVVPTAQDLGPAQKRWGGAAVFSLEQAEGQLPYQQWILYQFIRPWREVWQRLEGDNLRLDLARQQIYRALHLANSAEARLYFWEDSGFDQVFFLSLGLYQRPPSKGLGGGKDGDLAKQSLLIRLQKSEQFKQQAQSLALELKTHQVPWEVLGGAGDYRNLRQLALLKGQRQAQLALFRLALLSGRSALLPRLARAGLGRAKQGFAWARTVFLGPYLADFRGPDLGNLRDKILRYGLDFRWPSGHTSLMLAAQMGSVELVKTLVDLGADVGARDIDGLTALHHLMRAYGGGELSKGAYLALHRVLAPPQLRLRLYGQVEVYRPQQADYWVLQAALALSQEVLVHRAQRDMGQLGLGAQDWAKLLEVLAWSRRTWRLGAKVVGSSIKAKRSWLIRLAKGRYLLNPLLEVEEAGVFRSWYRDFLLLEQLAEDESPSVKQFLQDFLRVYQA